MSSEREMNSKNRAVSAKEFREKYLQKNRSKYKNQKVYFKNHMFDSKKERDYYLYLLSEKSKGNIKEIYLQPVIQLIPSFERNGEKYRAVTYIPDFKVVTKDDRVIYIDVKASKRFQDSLYRLKKKLLLWRYPDIEFKEVLDLDDRVL